MPSEGPSHLASFAGMSSSFIPRPPSPTLDDLVSSLGAGPSSLSSSRTRSRTTHDDGDDEDDYGDDGDIGEGGGGYVIPSLRRPSPPILTTAALALRSVPPELLSRDGGARSYRQALRREKKRLKHGASVDRARRSDTESQGEQGLESDDYDGDSDHALERAVRQFSKRNWPSLDVLEEEEKFMREEEKDLDRPQDGWTLADEVLAIVDRLDGQRHARRADRRLHKAQAEASGSSSTEDSESSSGSSSSASRSPRKSRGSTRGSRSSSPTKARSKADQTPHRTEGADAAGRREMASSSSSADSLAPLLVEMQSVMVQLWEELATEGGRLARGDEWDDSEDEEEGSEWSRSASRSRSRSRSQSQGRGVGRSASRAKSVKSAKSSGMDTGGEDDGEEEEAQDKDDEAHPADPADQLPGPESLNMRRHKWKSRPKDWHTVLRILARLPGVSVDVLRRTQERLEALYGEGGALLPSKSGAGKEEDEAQEWPGITSVESVAHLNGRIEAALASKADDVDSSASLDTALLDVTGLVPTHPAYSTLRAVHAARPSHGMVGHAPPTMLHLFSSKRKADPLVKAREKRERVREKSEVLMKREARRMRRIRRGRLVVSEDEEGASGGMAEVSSEEEETEPADGQGSGAGEEEDEDQETRDEAELREALLSRATPEGEE